MAVVAVLALAISCSEDESWSPELEAVHESCLDDMNVQRYQEDRDGGDYAGRSAAWWEGYGGANCLCLVDHLHDRGGEELSELPDYLVSECDGEAFSFADD